MLLFFFFTSESRKQCQKCVSREAFLLLPNQYFYKFYKLDFQTVSQIAGVGMNTSTFGFFTHHLNLQIFSIINVSSTSKIFLLL